MNTLAGSIRELDQMFAKSSNRAAALEQYGTTQVLVAASGQFIRMARENRLVPARSVWNKREIVRAELAHVQKQLSDCNDPSWLFQFSLTSEIEKLDFETELCSHVKRLEERKLELTTQLNMIETEIPELVQPQAELSSTDTSNDERVLFKGKRCHEIIEEMRKIKHMGIGRAHKMSEIQSKCPQFQVWNLADKLPQDERDLFDHPRQWGPVVRQAKVFLSMEYGCSNHTITKWVKAYRKANPDKKIKKTPL